MENKRFKIIKDSGESVYKKILKLKELPLTDKIKLKIQKLQQKL